MLAGGSGGLTGVSPLLSSQHSFAHYISHNSHFSQLENHIFTSIICKELTDVSPLLSSQHSFAHYISHNSDFSQFKYHIFTSIICKELKAPSWPPTSGLDFQICNGLLSCFHSWMLFTFCSFQFSAFLRTHMIFVHLHLNLYMTTYYL